MQQADVDRVQEFRKCIECFLCQDVCHVMREHHEEEEFIGPRFFVYTAALEMHPLDVADRVPDAQARPRDRLSATSRSAAPRSARRGSRSPTTRSFRSRSASSMSSTIRWAAREDLLAGASCIALRSRMRPQADHPCRRARGAAQGRALPADRDSSAAESICLDVLEVGSGQSAGARDARSVDHRSDARWARGERHARRARCCRGSRTSTSGSYYAGIICERRAKAQVGRGGPRAHHVAAQWLDEAMEPLREGRGDAAGRQR